MLTLHLRSEIQSLSDLKSVVTAGKAVLVSCWGGYGWF